MKGSRLQLKTKVALVTEAEQALAEAKKEGHGSAREVTQAEKVTTIQALYTLLLLFRH